MGVILKKKSSLTRDNSLKKEKHIKSVKPEVCIFPFAFVQA